MSTQKTNSHETSEVASTQISPSKQAESPSPTGDVSGHFHANLKLIALLLAVWAFVAFGLGILMADWLNQWRLPGTTFPLGFWFAQQGSIYVFVVLILIYVRSMRRIDRRFGVDEA
ncbi:MAG: DUF4212 domain-containing protein [Phycisphaerales bacterium]|nr:DUF4212 domain-containing protein [Phycisphaerales bacterium]